MLSIIKLIVMIFFSLYHEIIILTMESLRCFRLIGRFPFSSLYNIVGFHEADKVFTPL